MRSYYSHLETFATNSKGDLSHPVFRTSAIFPVFHRQEIQTRVLFLGYWILKRHIREIGALISLRDLQGTLVARDTFTITQAKCFSIEVAELLSKTTIPLDQEFEGSLEVEFFSTVNLFFPYPAVVVNYYGPQFSTVVHTAQRIYNDYEDALKNSIQSVPESGFNWHVKSSSEPFISFINGPYFAKSTPVKMEFYNAKNEKFSFEHLLTDLKPFQTTILYPARLVDLKTFFNEEAGAAKVSFQLNGVFPRLLVGNFDKDLPGLSITHTYYDCSKETGPSDYWEPSDEAFYPATLMIPVDLRNDLVTKAYFYPIYSPSFFAIDIEFYNQAGERLLTLKDYLEISSQNEALRSIDFKAAAKEQLPDVFAARVIARPKLLDGKEGKIPSRIKLGFDIGHDHKYLPCNICTNLQPFIPKWIDKPTSFKWAPILADQPQCALWLMNSSPEKNYSKQALLELSFFRQSDEKQLNRAMTIEPNGFAIIDPALDAELLEFFQERVGWVTVLSNNPYLTLYYFADHPEGIVGGDHGF